MDPTFTSILLLTELRMQFDVVLLFHGFHKYLKVHHLNRKWMDGLIEYRWKLGYTSKSNDGSVNVLFQASFQNKKNLWSKKKGVQLKQSTVFADPDYHKLIY